MKNSVKELTEGMQRLCAIANKIVSQDGEVSRIECDLLLEDLRRLYDVALRLGEGKAERGERKAESGAWGAEKVTEPDEEMLSSTVMATMAAMGVENGERKEGNGERRAENEAEPVAVEVEPVTEPVQKAEPVVVEEPVVEVDSVVKEEPVVEEEPVVKEVPVAVPEVPTMETLEDNGNSLLFDEVIIEEVEVENGERKVESGERRVENGDGRQDGGAPEGGHAAGTQASLLDYLQQTSQPQREATPNLGEQLQQPVRTLGESLGQRAAWNDQHTVLASAKKVSDLRTVININDKFSFMSELFHNNMKAYNDFILRLNAIDTRDEALMCVNEVSAQYKWDEGSAAVQSFYKVFDKKF